MTEFNDQARAHGVALELLPHPYACTCGVTGVKLWRRYNTCLDGQNLKCRACAEAEQGPAGGLEPRHGRGSGMGNTTAIGWRVPAIPDNTGTYWGFTSTPEDAFTWWLALPETAVT